MRNFFRTMIESMIESRQRQVNSEVARMLRSEFPHESEDHIEYMLNNGLYGVNR